MPIRAEELSAIAVKRLATPGIHAVGGVAGLVLQVTTTGARSWLMRIRYAGKRHEIGLGAYPDVPLAEARDRAREIRKAVYEGRDPVAERRAAREALAAAARAGLPFAKAVDLFLADRLAEFRNEKHKAQWRSTLDTYAAPIIGGKAVDKITVDDVLRVMQQEVTAKGQTGPLWSVLTETATRLRGRIEAVLSWATVAGHRSGDNPARWRGNLSELLPKPGKVAKADNQPAIALRDAAPWFTALQARDGVSARCLEFVALTACRSGEARGAVWGEIDLQAGIWTIPASRMKADREHRVALSAPAVDLLKRVPRLAGSDFVFAAPRGGALSDMSLSAVMRRMHADAIEDGGKGWVDAKSGRPAVPHGLRSSFRDWCAETGVDRDLAEITLAHVVGSDVERAYRRTDMFVRRRELMKKWADFLAGKVPDPADRAETNFTSA